MANKENRTRILGIGEIKKALRDFAKQAKSKINGKKIQRRKEIQEKLKKLEIRENNNNFPRAGVSDSEDEEFYGFCSDSEQRKAKVQEELRNGIGISGYAISTFGENTEEWEEGKLNLEQKKDERSNQIELSVGFGELGSILNNFEEDKMWATSQESIRRESVESQLRKIQEEAENVY